MTTYGFKMVCGDTHIEVTGRSSPEEAKRDVLQRFIDFNRWSPPALPVPFWKVWVRNDPLYALWKELGFPELTTEREA